MTIRTSTIRAVALAAAYAVALQALLGAFGFGVRPAGAGFDPFAVLCLSDRAAPPPGQPVGHDPACPCGAACTMAGCGGSACGGAARAATSEPPAPDLIAVAVATRDTATFAPARRSAGARPQPRAPPAA